MTTSKNRYSDFRNPNSDSEVGRRSDNRLKQETLLKEAEQELARLNKLCSEMKQNKLINLLARIDFIERVSNYLENKFNELEEKLMNLENKLIKTEIPRPPNSENRQRPEAGQSDNRNKNEKAD